MRKSGFNLGLTLLEVVTQPIVFIGTIWLSRQFMDTNKDGYANVAICVFMLISFISFCLSLYWAYKRRSGWLLLSWFLGCLVTAFVCLLYGCKLYWGSYFILFTE